MSGVELYSVVEYEDNLLETLFEFGMTSMIYCNTVSQRNFISIHFHTCSSVDLCHLRYIFFAFELNKEKKDPDL
jgi:hypothetical protein